MVEASRQRRYFVAVPGFGLHAAYLKEPLAAVAGDNLFRIFDLPGHGEGLAIPPPGPNLNRHQIAALVTDVITDVSRAEQPAYLLGESLGCTVVVEAARKLRHRGQPVSGLILVSPPVVPRIATLTRWTLTSVRNLANTLRGGVDVAAVYNEMLHDAAILPRLVSDPLVRKRVPVSYVLDSARLALDFGLRGLPPVKERTLAILGELDPLISSSCTKRLLGLNSMIEVQVIAGASHGVLWGPHADECSDRIRSWLEVEQA